MPSADHSQRVISVRHQLLGLVGWLALSFATEAVGAAASINAREFYAQLTQPTWAPPGWVFGPVWTVLYALMGISAWMIWRANGFARAARVALALFVIQLALNGLWSWLFFAWHKGALSFGEILVLWCFILATAIAFWRINRVAGALLFPYLAWVTFAAVLNYHMWRLNPVLLK